MTLAEFIATHNGKYLDYDGLYGAQCVDLIDYYCRDVLGIPIVWANAIDWYGQDATFEQWIPNVWGDQSNFPLPGDIIVWGKDAVVGTGVFGHIGICVTATGVAFRSFDQNWPPGSPCHSQPHSYHGVIGWGRAIKPQVGVQFGLAPVSFGQFLYSGRPDLKGATRTALLGEYLKESYPTRTDLQQNNRSEQQWLSDLLGEIVKELRV
jgi:hypothetical protein